MSLAKDQIFRYILKAGANPPIGYSTQAEVLVGSDVEYRHPTTGAVTIHTVTSIDFEEPVETITPTTYTYSYILADFPPKNDFQILPANMHITRTGFPTTREEGFGSSTKLTVITAT